MVVVDVDGFAALRRARRLMVEVVGCSMVAAGGAVLIMDGN